jgi:hypothetical protein
MYTYIYIYMHKNSSTATVLFLVGLFVFLFNHQDDPVRVISLQSLTLPGALQLHFSLRECFCNVNWLASSSKTACHTMREGTWDAAYTSAATIKH